MHLLVHLTAAWKFPFNFLGVGHPKLHFLGVSGHPQHPQWLHHCLLRYYMNGVWDARMYTLTGKKHSTSSHTTLDGGIIK